MQSSMIVQGRVVTHSDIQFIKELIASHPQWHRTQISRELCKLWSWYKDNGQLKDMACRTLLLKLEKVGLISLPARRRESVNQLRGKSKILLDIPTKEMVCSFKSLSELKIVLIHPQSHHHVLFNYLLSQYHYLGHKTTVGENMKYLVLDSLERPLSCVLFGSSAWKTQSRDSYIGWNHKEREKSVNMITNNTRFLILPWIKVPHLASHILGKIARRINDDWINKYSHPIYMLETFVDRSRFRGTCYKAANWILTGQTKGRTRNDRYSCIQTTIKDVYVYPLTKDFRAKLLL